MTEIDREHFCSRFTSQSDISGCVLRGDGHCKADDCRCCFSKWPTPAQFEEEYGRKPDIYQLCWVLNPWGEWTMGTTVLSYLGDRADVKVVQCTPYGMPPADWRPGE